MKRIHRASAGQARLWPLTFSVILLVIEASGLVYEQLVFIPNYFSSDPTAIKYAFSGFHVLSTPLTFHALFSALLVFGLVLVVRDWHSTSRRCVTGVLICVLAAGSLTAVAVMRINDALFFDAPVSGDIRRLAWAWSLLNLARIGLLAAAALGLWQVRERAVRPTRSALP